MAKGRRTEWIGNLAAYTVAGSTSSMLIGAALGLIGRLALPSNLGSLAPLTAAAVASVAMARELGLAPIPLPQLGRQTEERWAKVLPLRTAATLWGLDIGLSFATKLNYSGALLLAAVGFLSRDPAFSIALFVAYWLGRAASAWIGPWLTIHSSRDSSLLFMTISSQRKLLALLLSPRPRSDRRDWTDALTNLVHLKEVDRHVG